MKKLIPVCAILAIVIFVAAWLLLRPEALGNINASFTEPTTSASEVSFTAEQGDRVKFSFQSSIDAGELEIAVYASNGNAVYELDRAKALEAFFTFDSADTYTLRAEYTELIGDFKIAVYPAKEK